MEHQSDMVLFKEYPDVVGTDELSKMLGGISKKRAQRMLRENQIPSIRIGKIYKVAKVDVIDFVLRRAKPSRKTANK